MTRDRLDLLYRHCADLDVDVEWCDLGEFRRGEYLHGSNLIRLSLLMTRRQAIGALGHEVGHQAFGDTCSTPANERRADEFAAALLITPVEYRAAEAVVGHHVNSIAIELEVTPRIISAWRRWWEKRGQHLPSSEMKPLPHPGHGI